MNAIKKKTHELAPGDVVRRHVNWDKPSQPAVIIDSVVEWVKTDTGHAEIKLSDLPGPFPSTLHGEWDVIVTQQPRDPLRLELPTAPTTDYSGL